MRRRQCRGDRGGGGGGLPPTTSRRHHTRSHAYKQHYLHRRRPAGAALGTGSDAAHPQTDAGVPRAEYRVDVGRDKTGPHRTRQRCSGTVCDRRSASWPVSSRQNRLQRRWGGFDGTERAGMRSDGRKQGRNSADGCGEDRNLVATRALKSLRSTTVQG